MTAGPLGMIALLWISLPMIAIGTMAQTHSAAFREAEGEEMRDIIWRAFERAAPKYTRIPTGIGLGWGLAHSWLSVSVLYSLIAWAYTLGLQTLRLFCHRAPEVGQPLAWVFGLLCMVGAGLLLWLTVFGPCYQPGLLSLGYCTAASGLTCGIITACFFGTTCSHAK